MKIYTVLHSSNSMSNSPCVGKCSTSMAPFDETCKGCGRSVEEIRDWETYTELDKKLINLKNVMRGYSIRQKIESYGDEMNEKKQDIQGRMTTVISLLEMIGKDMLDEYGKDPKIKESYQALYNSREAILESKEHFNKQL
jgi:predicted Fe-S protein YdhL (DUF1289 family)